MKTYNNDLSYSDFTSEGIEKRGIEALSRALSMRRMIAFTASGTTMEYGRPAWVDLVNAYIHYVEQNYNRLLELKRKDNAGSTVIISPEFDSAWEEFISLFKQLKYRVDNNGTPDSAEDTDKDSSQESSKHPLRYEVLTKARKESRSYWGIPASLRDRPDFITTFLSICEDLATFVFPGEKISRSELLSNLREDIASQFAKTSLVDFYEATFKGLNEPQELNDQSNGEDKSEQRNGWLKTLELLKIKTENIDTTTSDSDLKSRVNKALTDEYGDYYHRVSYDSSGVSRVNSNARIAILCHTLELRLNAQGVSNALPHYKDLLGPMFSKQQLDPLSVMYDDLEIRRFLTLNFDIEIERMLATHYANHKDTRHVDFLKFLKKPIDDRVSKKSKRDLSNGLKKAVRSSTIGEGNLGDLFTFGAFPANFDALVFHLHGRVDDPGNMIITQPDYERLYLSSTNLRRSFEEARHAVFSGSDILFVGTGLNESDVISPLRDFTARHRQMDDVSGRVYALLLSSTSKRFKGENIGLSQTLYKNYGVYTIFVDGGDDHKQIRKDRFYLDRLVELLDDKPNTDEKNTDEKSDSERLEHTIKGEDLIGFVRHTLKEKAKSDKDKDNDVLAGREIQIAFGVLDAVSEKALSNAQLSKDKVSGLSDIKLSVEYTRLLRQIMLALLTRIRSRALEDNLQELARKRIDWWQSWKSRPEHRVAYYGEYRKDHDSAGPLLWVRQQADYVYPNDSLEGYFENKNGNKEEFSYFGHYLNALTHLKSDKTAAVRIKRVVAPKCGGKGSLVRFLSEPFEVANGYDSPQPCSNRPHYYPFEYVFAASDNRSPGKGVQYAGGFFAHLTFTLEFTSTIFALVRFIIKAANIQHDELSPESISCNEPDRNTGLWMLTLALSELEKKKPRVRIFICLSGLYRLVDENGDAYSPVHREFFRILTAARKAGKSKKKHKTSVDLLLIAMEQKFPIRYLSREVVQPLSKKTPKVIVRHEKQYKFRDDRETWLKRWERLPLASIEQSLEMAIYVAEYYFDAYLKNADTKHAMRTLVHQKLEKEAEGSKWADLIDFIKSRVVYTQVIVRLLYWYGAVHDEQRKKCQLPHAFDEGVRDLLGRLAIIIGQGTEQDLMRQLIIEYRRLDKECLSTGDGLLNVKVDVFDVIMRHLALFSYPVQPCVLLSCPDLVFRLSSDDTDSSNDNTIQSALDILVKRGLVIRVEPCCSDGNDEDVKLKTSDDKNMRCRYILHRDALEVITRDMNYITQYGISAAPYQSTFYCAQVQARRGVPSVEHFNFVSKLLKHGLSRNRNFTRRNTVLSNQGETFSADSIGFYQASAVVRGAYAILRGSFSIGAVSRLGQPDEFHNQQPYEAYRSWIQDILNCAVGLSEYRDKVYQLKKKDDGFNVEKFQHNYNQPFYRDEVAWLYNEYAVVSFMQGRLFDANALYNQAIRALSAEEHDDEDQSVGAPRRRIQINLALTEIELGNIRDARILLDQVIGELVIKPHSTVSVSLIYAKGYRALCDHLTGNFTQAEKGYFSVIKSVLKKRQLRAASIFKRHLADLLRVQGKREQAEQYLLLSEKTATQSQQEDILHYTLIARARLMRDLESRSDALQILRQTEDYAKAMGLQKMLAETLKVRAEVMLAEGEVTQAGKMAAQAVAISKRNGMRLRKISAALLQAKVCAKRGQMDFAKQILDEIDQESGELGYTLKLGDAQNFRQSIL